MSRTLTNYIGECKSTTHHEGCACHEARRDAEIAILRKALDLVQEVVSPDSQAWEFIIEAREALEALNGGKKG